MEQQQSAPYSTGFSVSKFSNKVMLILRAIQLIFTIIVLGLTASTISNNTYRSGMYIYRYESSQDNFVIFVTVWSILAIPYLVFTPLWAPSIAHPIAFLAVECLSWIFWLSGWAALMATWGTLGDCGPISPCKTGKASAALSLINWVFWSVTLSFVIKSAIPYFRSNGHKVKAVGIPGGELPSVAADTTAQGPVVLDNSQLEAGVDKQQEAVPIEMSQTSPNPPQTAAVYNSPQ